MRTLVVGALVILAAGVGIAVLSGSPGRESPDAPALSATKEEIALDVPDIPLRFEQSLPAAEVDEAAEPAPGDYADLPPVDTPLASSLPELVARAERGEPNASCRLTLELLRCQDQFSRDKRLKEMEHFLSKQEGSHPQDDRLVNVIASREEKFSRLAQHCSGVDPSLARDAGRYLARAAANLSPRQKTLLAMARPDGLLDRLPRSPRDIVPVELDTDFVYPQFLAENAYAFLQAGIAAADPLALEGMLMVHSPSWIPGIARDTRISLPNARIFSFYAFVQANLYGSDSLGVFGNDILSQARASLAPADIESIERAAGKEAERWRSLHSAAAQSGRQPTDMPSRSSIVCS